MYKSMRKFSTRTPDLGPMIGRNKRNNKERQMPGLATTRTVEMMNAFKVAIAQYEEEYLRSTIKTMLDPKVRKSMREDLMNTCYMTDVMWEKFDNIIHDSKTRYLDPRRHLWDFPCLSYTLEGRNRRTIAALIIWLKETHGVTKPKWDAKEVLKCAKAIKIGNVIAFKNSHAKEGEVGYSLGIVFKLVSAFIHYIIVK
jgi:hypothetical protein